jgi:anaerobic magnesium-protoporphyrin IX monomethyl ester cyclase
LATIDCLANHENMKILLVRPFNKESFTVVPPLGLGYLATSLRKTGFKVKILDCVKEKITSEVFNQILKKERPDLVGITVFSSDLVITKEYLEKVKTFNKKIITVIGGPHPSAMPKECFDYYQDILDFAFIGEAELGFPELVKDLAEKRHPEARNLKKIPGLVWKQNTKVIVNKPKFPMDLDRIGFPSWDLIKPESYPHAPIGGFARRFPVAYILTSRSCPFNCTFCAAKATHGPIFRRKSLHEVMKEVKYLTQKRGIKEIHILDDNFTLDKEFVKEFCLTKMKEKLDFTWNCSNGIRLDRVDEETLTLMKQAGCYSVAVGIESGSARILKHMKKNLTKDYIKKQVDLIRKVGLEVTGLFILGYPAETKKDILETISFATSLNLTKAAFSIFGPLPGSEMWDYLTKQGRLDLSHLHNLSYYRTDSNYMQGVSQKDFRSLQKKAFFDFYLRPKIIWILIKETSSPQHILALFKRVVFYLQIWFVPPKKLLFGPNN